VGTANVSGQIAFKLVDTTTGEAQYYLGNKTTFTDLAPFSGWYQWSVKFPSTIADGTYLMTMAVANSDGTKFYDAHADVSNSSCTLIATVSDGTVTFSSSAATSGPKLELTDVQITSKMIAPGLDLDVTATATNVSNAYYYGNVFAVICASADDLSNGNYTTGGQIALDLDVGETADFAYSATLSSSLTPGTYYLLFVDATTYYYCSDPVEFTVSEAPDAGVLKFSNLKMLSTQPGNLQAQVTVTCTSGYFDNTVYFALFPSTGGQSLTMWATPKVKLNEGESVDVSASTIYASGVVGQYYMFGPYYKDANNSWAQDPENYCMYFVFTDFELQSNSIDVTSTRIDNLEFEVNVTNAGDAYNDKIYLTISKDDKVAATLESDAVELDKNGTATVTIAGEFPAGEVDSEYTVNAYYLNSLGVKKPMATSATFVLQDMLTSIRSVEAVADSDAVEYFDLQGRRLGSLPASGVVIRRQGNTAAKIHL
jgi:hypothetical protein